MPGAASPPRAADGLRCLPCFAAALAFARCARRRGRGTSGGGCHGRPKNAMSLAMSDSESPRPDFKMAAVSAYGLILTVPGGPKPCRWSSRPAGSSHARAWSSDSGWPPAGPRPNRLQSASIRRVRCVRTVRELPANIGHYRSRTESARSKMSSDRNAWCPVATHSLAVEAAFDLQWSWSSGAVAGPTAAR